MKKLSTRTKILLAIAGVVIVVIVGGLVLVGPAETNLFGATTLVITPSNPTQALGGIQVLSVNAVWPCNWFTSNSDIADFINSHVDTKVVQVRTKAVGTATIEARCGAVYSNHVSTVITVYRPY